MNSFLKLVIVLAVAHLLAALGFVTWLFASGRVDGERMCDRFAAFVDWMRGRARLSAIGDWLERGPIIAP